MYHWLDIRKTSKCQLWRINQQHFLKMCSANTLIFCCFSKLQVNSFKPHLTSPKNLTWEWYKLWLHVSCYLTLQLAGLTICFMQHSIPLISELVIKYILKAKSMFSRKTIAEISLKKKKKKGRGKEFDLDKDEASKLHVVKTGKS